VAVRDEARAAVRESERDFNRRKELHERNVASQTQLDQSETELTLAKSRLNAAEAQLGVADRAVRDATVRAPFSGLIAARFVSRGEYVTAGQKLFELVSLDPIEVEFRLTEADSGRVALDQKVEVRVASNPNDVFYGEVTVIAPVIDEKSRTLRVKAQIENSDARLRPGLFARIDLGLDTRENAVLVPEEAILQRADGSVVFRATPDGRVERVVIETGVVRNGRVEATRGLAAGDHIVTRGQFRLTDGQLVSSRTAEGDLVGSTAAPPPVSGSPN
jgi:membrane fusion protein (multidrug efflux system)